MNRNVYVLSVAQALAMSVNSVIVFIGGIAGAKLAGNPAMATLPVGAVTVGTALSVVPVSLLMKKLGRKQSFYVFLILSFFNSLLAAYALYLGSFYLFVGCCLLFGPTVATVLQFRFAAIESVSADKIPTAASVVLVGGMASAILGPELALFGKSLFPTEFAGSFILISILFLLCMGVVSLYKNNVTVVEQNPKPARSIAEISKQPVFWIAVLSGAVAYAVMSFIMTATPVSMHSIHGHSLEDTKLVIQSHILAMYVPSLFTGWTVRQTGLKNLMFLGLLIYLACIAIGFSGHGFIQYWFSLVFLGIGWNFLFIGGTSLLPRSYLPEERFKVQAFNEFVVFSLQAAASLSAGWFVFQFGWEIMLVSLIPVILAQGILVARTRF